VTGLLRMPSRCLMALIRSSCAALLRTRFAMPVACVMEVLMRPTIANVPGSRLHPVSMSDRTVIYHRLVPLDASPEERSALIDDIANLHWDLRDGGADVTVDLQCTPDGDVYTLAFEMDADVAA
jgi:hypothetical protein